jgi:hypothetical protein
MKLKTHKKNKFSFYREPNYINFFISYIRVFDYISKTFSPCSNSLSTYVIAILR